MDSETKDQYKHIGLGCLVLLSLPLVLLFWEQLIPPPHVRQTPEFYWGSRIVFWMLLALGVFFLKKK